MPNDVITLNALTTELNAILSGGKVEKIYQPESDEVTLLIKSKGQPYLLAVSANPSHPRAHISTQKKENALNAPAFCMLLRKYLVGSVLTQAELFQCDRIILFHFDARSELKDKQKYFLYAELMGRYSNIILTKEDGTIVDAIKRIHFDQTTSRYILPGLKYTLQEQSKIRLDDTENLAKFFDENPHPDINTLLMNVGGMGKDTAKELLFEGDTFSKLRTFFEVHHSPAYNPCVRIEKEKPKDYYIFPYRSAQGEYRSFPTLNQCMDFYYSHYDGTERKKANTKTLTTLLKRLKSKLERRTEDNLKKLEESEKAENYRQIGDLIISNLHLIHNNSTLECYNYYDNSEITIRLDPALSPQKNAQEYYKKYGKLKRAAEYASAQLDALKLQQEYLLSIEASLENCTQKQEFNEILDELNTLAGYRKNQPKNPKSKVKPSTPNRYVFDGYSIYAGKNNLQNVEVTFDIASGNDLWFHVKNAHGSHVILKGKITDEAVFRAAGIAAYFSQLRTAEKAEVDYTFKKYVKKIPSGHASMVSYAQYKTIYVAPCDHPDFLK